MLPKDYPKWELVYYYFRKWSFYEEFDLLLSRLRESVRVRVKRKQNKEPSLGFIDSQSVKWGNNKALNNIEGNKKIKSIKRHVVVDKNGFYSCDGYSSMIPADVSIHEDLYINRIKQYLNRLKELDTDNSIPTLTNEQLHTLEHIKEDTNAAIPPLQRLEHSMHPLLIFPSSH